MLGSLMLDNAKLLAQINILKQQLEDANKKITENEEAYLSTVSDK